MSNKVQASRTRGRVMVEGPLRVGSDVLLSGNTMRGDVVLVKRVALSADGAYTFRLPASNIIDARAQIITAPGTAATVRIGNGTDIDYYGTVSFDAVTAVGATLSAASLLAVASGATITVDVTTVGTAGAQVGSLYVTYVQTGTPD